MLPQVPDSSTTSSLTSTPLSSPSPAQSHLQPIYDSMKHPDASPKHASACDARRRVVCAKFRAGPHPPPHSPANAHAVASGTGGGEDRGDSSGWWRRGSRDATAVETFGRRDGRAFVVSAEAAASQDRLGTGDEDENSVWIIMDLLNDSSAHDSVAVFSDHADLSACQPSTTSSVYCTATRPLPAVHPLPPATLQKARPPMPTTSFRRRVDPQDSLDLHLQRVQR